MRLVPPRRSAGSSPVGVAAVAAGLVGSLGLGACNYRHSAPVRASDLPPPPGERELHSSPLVVEVLPSTDDSQCVAYEGYRTLCFHDVREAVEKAVSQGLWPSYPGVRLGTAEDARPSEYVLQVEVRLTALPPDAAGPGWSAGLEGHFRLLRDGVVLTEETLASRSRAEFPYGSALGQGASEVIDALGTHVAASVGRVAESRPVAPRPLPPVAARVIPITTPPSVEAVAAEAGDAETAPVASTSSPGAGGTKTPASASSPSAATPREPAAKSSEAPPSAAPVRAKQR